MVHEASEHDSHSAQSSPSAAGDDLRHRTSYLEQEIDLLRAKVAESPRHIRLLEDRLTLWIGQHRHETHRFDSRHHRFAVMPM